MTIDEKTFKMMPADLQALFRKLPNPGSEEVLAGFPSPHGAGGLRGGGLSKEGGSIFCGNHEGNGMRFGDSGSAARFFYCAKSSRKDRNKGLDNTRTVKYGIQQIGELSCKDVSMALVQSLEKVTLGLAALKWHIGENGESIMGLCQLDSLSTTLTAIRKITTLEILNSLPPSLTSAFTPVVNLEMVNGGNPAGSVELLNAYPQSSTLERSESARGVNHAVSQILSTISDAENWKPYTNIHNTVKPNDLMRYLCRLVTRPAGTVLDPFMGSGSTGVSSVMEGFNFIGIDKEKEYVSISALRIQAATPRKILQPKLIEF